MMIIIENSWCMIIINDNTVFAKNNGITTLGDWN